MSKNGRRRMLYLGTILAMISASAGFVVATGLTATSTNQNVSWYQVNNQAPANFPTAPTIQATTIPASVSACTSSAQSLASGGTVNLYLGASSTVTCATSDFAEEFTLTTFATASAGSHVLQTFTSYGSGPTTGSAAGTVTFTGTFTVSGTVNVYVDFGSPLPPAGGIGELDLIIQ